MGMRGSMKNKAFLLDRDGTINVDTGYVASPEDIVLLPKASEAIQLMRKSGFKVIVVTNQSGIARGYFTEEDAQKVNCRLNELLMENGAKIDAFYMCPHYKEGKIAQYSIDCECRKPGLKLYEQAISDFDLDPRLCAAFGDKPSDTANLTKLGIPFLGLLKKGEPGCYDSLYDFASSVISRCKDHVE